jgi:outer membrane protein assembly factor BamB
MRDDVGVRPDASASSSPSPGSGQPTGSIPPTGDARRPGWRNRLRRLVHPHRRTVIRTVTVLAIIVVALAGIGGAIRTLRADDAPPIDPSNVDRLTAAWTADLGFGPVAGLAADGDTLYVSTGEALVGIEVPCASTPDEPCRPAWRGLVPDGPVSAPTVFSDRVYAGSARGLVYAFPARCPANGCAPEWSGVAGKGQVSQPAVNEDFVYVTSDRLYAFPSACATGDRPCPPAWSAAIPGEASSGPPALGGGLVIVTSSSVDGGVFAFPAVCATRCDPVWTASTDGPATAATVQGDTAYVIARGRLLAFPLTCEGDCAPSWTGVFRPGGGFATGSLAPASPAGNLVYVGDDRGTLWVFPSSCALPTCDPARSWAIGSSALLQPLAEGGLVYATSIDGALHTIADVCDPVGEACDPPHSTPVGGASRTGPAVGQGAVYVGDDAGRVHAYTPQTEPTAS